MLSQKRRNRRKFDRPQHDLDITNYHVWQSYERVLPRGGEHSSPLVCRLMVSPALFTKAFGQGKPLLTRSKSATREYDFEDMNLDLFLVYDYR